MAARLLLFVLEAVADFLALALLARLWLQWARAPFRNPIGRFVCAVTDWAVLPVRRAVPGLFGIDLGTLLLAWTVEAAYFATALALLGAASMHATSIAALAPALAAVEVLRLTVYLAMGLVLVAALLSWINPYAPLAPLIDGLAAPLLKPFRRRIPPVGGVDLSPLVLLLALQVLVMLLDALRDGLVRLLA